MRRLHALSAFLALSALSTVAVLEYRSFDPAVRPLVLVPIALLMSGAYAAVLLAPHLPASGPFRLVAAALPAGVVATTVGEAVASLERAARIGGAAREPLALAVDWGLVAIALAVFALAWRARAPGSARARLLALAALSALALAPWTRGLAIPAIAVAQLLAVVGALVPPASARPEAATASARAAP